MNFKEYLNENQESLEDKEKRYLGWIVRSIVNQRSGDADPQKAAYNMFIRIFGFDPNRYKDEFINNFQYYFISPSYDYFNEQQIKEIEKIAGIEYLSRYMGGNERLNLYHLFQDIASKFDTPEEKLIRIMNIIFDVVGQKMIARGHKGWEQLLFKKNLKQDTQKVFGGMLDEI